VSMVPGHASARTEACSPPCWAGPVLPLDSPFLLRGAWGLGSEWRPLPNCRKRLIAVGLVVLPLRNSSCASWWPEGGVVAFHRRQLGHWASAAVGARFFRFMVNRTLIRNLENDPDIQSMFESAVTGFEEQGLNPAEGGGDFDVNKIVEGRILRVADGMVMVDIGFKSEGSIPLNEWEEGDEPPQVGQLVRVLIEDLEDEQAQLDDSGMVRISKKKAK